MEEMLETKGKVAGLKRPVTGYRLQVTGHKLQVSGHGLQVASYKMQASGEQSLRCNLDSNRKLHVSGFWPV